MEKDYKYYLRNYLQSKTKNSIIFVLMLSFVITGCVTRNIKPSSVNKSAYEDSYDKILKLDDTIAPVVDGHGRLISLGSSGKTPSIQYDDDVQHKTKIQQKLAPVVNAHEATIYQDDDLDAETKKEIPNKTVEKSNITQKANEKEISGETLSTSPEYNDEYYQDNDSSYKPYTRSIRTKDDDEYYPLYKYGKKGSIDRSSDINTRGVYEPFPTDNAVPFKDNEEDFFNDTFLYEY